MENREDRIVRLLESIVCEFRLQRVDLQDMITRLNALEAGRHIIGKPVVLLADVRAAEEADCVIMKAGTTVYLSKEISGAFLKKLPDST